jgi:GT2 family glycosyltransferase
VDLALNKIGNMMPCKKIAILIINYNGKTKLANCLKSLDNAREANGLFDIYLVDNNSSDGSRALAKTFPSVNVVNSGSDLGFTGGYNYLDDYLVKSKKEYKYYFFISHDIVINDPKVFSRMIYVYENLGKMGIINPTILNLDRTIQFRTGSFNFLTGTPDGNFSNQPYKSVDNVTSSKWATGCAFFTSAELFRKVGRFDDYFMYFEDINLSWKILNSGHAVVTDFGSSLIHDNNKNPKSPEFAHFFAERNRMIMYWQNLSSLVFFCFLPLFMLTRLVIIIGWFILKDQNAKIALARLKGLWRALFVFKRFPKRNRSMRNDFKMIRYFHSAPKVIDFN